MQYTDSVIMISDVMGFIKYCKQIAKLSDAQQLLYPQQQQQQQISNDLSLASQYKIFSVLFLAKQRV